MRARAHTPPSTYTLGEYILIHACKRGSVNSTDIFSDEFPLRAVWKWVSISPTTVKAMVVKSAQVSLPYLLDLDSTDNTKFLPCSAVVLDP